MSDNGIPRVHHLSAPVPAAVAGLRAGATVVVFDDQRGEADLVIAADRATTENLAFMIRHTGGYVNVALPPNDCARLQLPPMWGISEDNVQRGPTVTVDAARGGGTGISAADRANTIRALADPAAAPDDFTRPGHVAPVKAHARGMAAVHGTAEAVVYLTGESGLRSAGAYSELVSAVDETRMATREESMAFAREHGLAFVCIADVVAHAAVARRNSA